MQVLDQNLFLHELYIFLINNYGMLKKIWKSSVPLDWQQLFWGFTAVRYISTFYTNL